MGEHRGICVKFLGGTHNECGNRQQTGPTVARYWAADHVHAGAGWAACGGAGERDGVRVTVKRYFIALHTR